MLIEKLNLSVCTRNALLRGHIRTIGDLTEMTRKELLKIRGIGPKSVQEIIAALAKIGKNLREGEEKPSYDNQIWLLKKAMHEHYFAIAEIKIKIKALEKAQKKQGA